MNERINQLRLEAGISRLHDEPKFMVAVSKEGTVIEPLDGLEKFAELIVKECADKVHELIISDGNEFPMKSVSYRLKQHFVVKE